MHDHTTPEQVKKNRLEGTNAEKKTATVKTVPYRAKAR